jgi:pyridoxamine 5'-phosphate oxidase
MRRDYRLAGLTESDLAPDWLSQFQRWLTEAAQAGITEPNAMVVATADPGGHPSARTVLLKAVDGRGFVFYTNYTSRKGREAEANPYASLVFPWYPLDRQVLVSGSVSRVERDLSDEYFASRPRPSQLGAWASPQSQIVADRAALDAAYDETVARFGDDPVPAPPHWGGLRVAPDTVEFWQGRTGRMHDRLRFRRLGDGWVVERLAP